MSRFTQSWTSMSPKDFATTYRGKLVTTQYNPDCLPEATGKVIGYSNDSVILGFDNTIGGWETASKHYVYFEHAKRAWAVNVLDILDVAPKKTKEKIKLYKHTCRLCGSSARNANNVVFCSNPRCKSQKKYINSIVAKKKRTERTDKEGFLICPECSERARYSDSNSMFCVYNHCWDVERKSGDKLDNDNYIYQWIVPPPGPLGPLCGNWTYIGLGPNGNNS